MHENCEAVGGIAVFLPDRAFLLRKNANGNAKASRLCIFPQERGKAHNRGKNRRQASVFSAGAAFPCSAGARGRPGSPAGGAGPAGSARTRSRDSSLENPFLGNGSHFPTAPSPKPPQAASPCSWTCRRLHALSPHSERNAANPPLARGAGLRQHGAEGAGRRPCRPALDSHPFPCYNGRTRGEGCF